MLTPNFNNNFNNKKVNINKSQTLGQVLYGQPVINTLNDIIGKNNQSFLKENILDLNNTNIQNNNSSNILQQINNSKDTLNFINKDNNTNTDNPTNNSSNNSTNSNDKNESKSSNYSTELIDSKSSSLVKTSDTSNLSDNNEEIISETKFYWEYGNTGLKMKQFKPIMSRNLAIMYYIDRLFNEYIDGILSNDYSKLFSPNSNVKFNLGTGTIKSNKGKVIAILNHKKIKGTFDVLEAGFFTISDIQIKDKELKNNLIPNLESILAHKDNIYHISKIIKLLSFHNRMTIKSNLSNKNTTIETIGLNAESYLNDLIKKNKKKNILKSNKNSGFYIKIYNDHGKGFIIDNLNNLIYYIAANINFKSQTINVRYYSFNLEKGMIKKL